MAIKCGEQPEDPRKYAPHADAINLIAGMTIWLKFVADFILSRRAYTFSCGKKGLKV